MDELGSEPFGHLDEDYLAYLFLGGASAQQAPQTPQQQHQQPPRLPQPPTPSAAFEQQELLEELERHFDLDLEFDLADLLEDGEGAIALPNRKQRRFTFNHQPAGDNDPSTPLLPNIDLSGQESPVGNDSPSFTSTSSSISSSQFPMLPFLPPEFFSLCPPPRTPPPPHLAAAAAHLPPIIPYSCPLPSAAMLQLAHAAPIQAAVHLPVLQGSVSNGAGVQRNVLRLDEKSADHVITAPARPAESGGMEVGKIHDLMARRKVKGVRRSKMMTGLSTARTTTVTADHHHRATHHLASALSAMSVGTASAAAAPGGTAPRYQRPFHFSAPPPLPSGP